MSVRVRCRCGQELHLRYGEWVYVFLGLVVLCMALNSLALLLIYFQIERIDERAAAAALEPSATEASGESRAEPAAPRRTVEKSGPATGARKKSGGVPVGAAEPAAEEARLPSGAGSRPPGDESAEVGRPVDSEALERDGAPGTASPPGDDVARGGESGAAVGEDPDIATASAEVSIAAEGFFASEAPLVRLLLLEQAPGGLDWRLAFFLDEDHRLRQRALEKLRSYTARVTSNQERFRSRRARQWLSVVRRSLEGRADGQRLLGDLLTLFPYAPDESSLASVKMPELLSMTSRPGEVFLEKAPVRSVRDGARRIAEDGLDCVLLVDVSQSMEDVLVLARRQVARLWPVLSWGLPGVRLGVVLYQDHVVGVLDFSMGIEEQLARLEEVEATAGGDVPEGLHLAIKQSLGLGVFDWRPDAAKHLIVLGDAPPPYSEQPGLASLVRRARLQAGFRVHTLGVRPEEGRESVPFFPQLAAAGGGRSRTVDPATIGTEVCLCIQPDSSAEVLEPLLEAAHRLLSR